MPLSRREFLRASSLSPAFLVTRKLNNDSDVGYCQSQPYPIVNISGVITTPENLDMTAYRILAGKDRGTVIPHPEDLMELKIVNGQIPFIELNRQAMLDFNPVETRISCHEPTRQTYGSANFPLTDVLPQDGLARTMSFSSPKDPQLYIGPHGILSTPCTNYAVVSSETTTLDTILVVLSRGMYKLQTTSGNGVFSVLEPAEQIYIYIENLNITLPSSSKILPPRHLITT